MRNYDDFYEDIEGQEDSRDHQGEDEGFGDNFSKPKSYNYDDDDYEYDDDEEDEY
nr:highly acidic protein [uncultured Campylobacter sp.]